MASTKRIADQEEAATVNVDDLKMSKGQLKSLGGSNSDYWNEVLAAQTAKSLWLQHSHQAERDKQYHAMIVGLRGIRLRTSWKG